MSVGESYLENLNNYIASNQPVDPHEILATVSCRGNRFGKEVYEQMIKGEEIINGKPQSHKFFADSGSGYVNYALYHSPVTDKIYCVRSGYCMGKIIFTNYTIIEDSSIFDKYSGI